MSKFPFILLLLGQFIALIYYHWNYSSQSSHIEFILQRNQQLLSQIEILGKELEMSHQIEKNRSIIINNYKNRNSNVNNQNNFIKPGGAAITLMNDHPKWFQRRYTIMIQNTLNNIPKDWIIQIFHVDDEQFRSGLAINGGILKLIQKYPNRIFFTPLPVHVSKERKRPIHIMTHPWLWENMMSDKVLVFGGNHVICSNSPYKLEDFLSYDYISAPWYNYQGIGGGSGLSIRNRKVMLSLIYNKLNQTEVEKRDKAYQDWGRDDEFFVGEIIATNKIKNQQYYNLPKKEIVAQFSASGSILSLNQSHFPFSVSDTLAGVKLDVRAQMIDLCPEMKILFPSLHEPGCFGASLQREKCAASICALDPNKHSC